MERPLTVKDIEAEYLRVYKAPPPSPKSAKGKGVKRSMEPMKPEAGPSGVKKAKPTTVNEPMALVEMEEKLREWVGLFQQAAIDMHKIADKLRKHQ
jgi:hypothetical protein